MARPITLATLLVRGRARAQQAARNGILFLLGGTVVPSGDSALDRIANTLTRYGQTQATVYDTASSGTPAAAGVSLLERQVDRAFTQVLGRGVGRGSSSFMTALNGTFPMGADGQVQFSPARSAVALVTPTSGYSGPNGVNTPVAQIAAGLAGQLSAEQATLYRQASIIGADLLNILAGIQPFVPEAESDKVEALRALVGSQVNTIIEEFGRVEEPREDRVTSYFAALRGPNGTLKEFARRAFLDRSLVTPVTPDDEATMAGFDLLTNYVDLLQASFASYIGAVTQRPNSLQFPLFTLRLQRASVMLPVLGEGVNNFMQAMDSVGFTERERRSQAAKFTLLSLVPPPPPRPAGAAPQVPANPLLPDITVSDFTDEVDRLANTDGPAYLADSGEYGLAQVADQAHRLFMELGPIMAWIPPATEPNINSLPLVAQVLAHERVNWSLQDLFRQMDALAALAA
jgi:hypothetical protein